MDDSAVSVNKSGIMNETNPDDSVVCMESEDQCNNNDVDKKTSNEASISNSSPATSSKSNKSATKIDKNLKLQMKLELAKQREVEKERKEREKKEREEQRLKREADMKRKREEEEMLRKKKAEELRLKREEDKQKKEEERQKREEEKEKLLQERLEKEKKRQEQINAKNEEKRRKEEEKQREEDEKRRKADKVKNQFQSYFIKKETPSEEKETNAKHHRFMPFQLKENMSVAPLSRRNDFLNMNDEQRVEFMSKLDDKVFGTTNNECHVNYLKEIRANPSLIRRQLGSCRRRQSAKSVSDSVSTDEIKVISVLDENSTKFKVKYLHFDPKIFRRPPYYGTWTKKSATIKPRRPFAKDEKLFDYEIDSDDEWEDEPADGESIDGSDKGDMEEDLADEDDDDGFLVPHGHLSDDELDEEERMVDPATKKAREEAKSKQWEMERKKGSKFLVPKCFNSLGLLGKSRENMRASDQDDLCHLARLIMKPLSSCLPITIKTDEFLATKAAEESAARAAAKATAKAAAQLEAMNNSCASPTSSAKPNKNSKLVKQSQNSPSTSSTAATTFNSSSTSHPNSPATASTPSIINFISKMSNKKVVCRLESVDDKTPSAVATPTTPKSHTTDSQQPSATTAKTPSLASTITPNNTKKTPNMSSTAEKRISSNERDSCVKRLKLDNNTMETSHKPGNESSPIPVAPVSTAAAVVTNLFKSVRNGKNRLSLPKTFQESTANTSLTSSNSPNLDTSSSRKPQSSAVLQVSKESSSNSPIKMDCSESTTHDAKVRSFSLQPKNRENDPNQNRSIENGKENLGDKKNCIVLD